MSCDCNVDYLHDIIVTDVDAMIIKHRKAEVAKIKSKDFIEVNGTSHAL